ncbi:MAG: GDP-mannose 4,6-dehydratase, partial [Ignavibacteriae bacterium]
TGETHPVREFTNLTFQNIGIELEWSGKGENEIGKIKTIDLDKAKSLIDYSSKRDLFSFEFTSELKTGDIVVAVDPNYYRPTEVDLLIGDAAKVEKEIGWKAETKFEDIVRLMIKSDMGKVLKRGF